MRFFTFGIIALLSVSGIAFEVTIYNNVYDCDANGQTEYRIISGISDGACHAFDQAMPGTDCAQYTNGGVHNEGCDSGSLLPKSVLVQNDNRVCYFYEDSRCDIGTAVWDGCSVAEDRGWANYKSFRCDWDDHVDILGNVGCRNGVSSNVCVNDCDCRCNGQNLDCPDEGQMPGTCNKFALITCTSNCGCMNP